ncbi:MAG: amino acid adenylation domain-containing protein [Pyrinomonadaceae bacterium]
MATELSKLSAAKRAVFEKRLRGRLSKGAPEGQLVRRARQSHTPLSFAQQRLWFLYQLEPDTPFYNISRVFFLSGSLDARALGRSLDEVVRRHEILRTSFVEVDGEPSQVVAEARPGALRVIDLRALTEAERACEVERLSTEQARLPFDLTRGPLLRALLLRLGDEEAALVLTVHHIIADGWSMDVLFRELGALYESFGAGEEATLAELPVQYADYALWQRGRLDGELLETQLAYWRRRLAGHLPVLELPTDRPRPAVKTFGGAQCSLVLSEALSDSLRELGRREGATLFMTLLASFKALLHHYTRQTDIVVGSPIANRNQVEAEGLIGFFVNTLALRTDLSGDPTFSELLAQVREGTLGAHEHQDVPFEKVVESLQAERSRSHTPVFQAMLVLQNAGGESLKLKGLKLRTRDVDNGTSKFDMTLTLEDDGRELTAALRYSTDLFDAETAERMLRHFKTLLEGVASDSGRRLSELPLLDEEEERRVVAEWNDTRADYTRACVHQLFEQRAAETPDALAVVCERERLTYAELNERANRLAHHLRRLGVGPETRVGVLMSRGTEMVVSLLAILKAGGAYVPLDPEYPRERLSFISEDAGFSLLLAQGATAGELSLPGVGVFDVDGVRELTAGESVENPTAQASPENLAYIIYTSGSTGRPKGVMIEHGSFANYLHWVNGGEPSASLRHLPFTGSLSFDASLKQLFAPLLRGGEVRILSNEVARQPEQLVREFAARAEVGFNCVPSMWEAMLSVIESGGHAADLGGLTSLVVGGERLSAELVDRTFKALPHLRLWNFYGPTEATANATFASIKHKDEISIGRPLQNTQVYVLDARMRPAPVGVPGELYVGGVGVARGYLNRPSLTAEKFVPDTFSNEPGARLYRTGDVVRRLSDGRIEFIGRADDQVKVRGFRIELGEIEAALSSHESVRDCAVVAREDRPGDVRLVAYVVAADACKPSAGEPVVVASELRGHLKERLPEYMVPSAFVMLDALPLNANGKVDRKALAATPATQADACDSYVAPRDATEEMIAGVWAEVLRVERVGAHDDFFALGGHSLKATQVVSRLRRLFSVELPLRALFAAPTVAELAGSVEALRATGASTLPPVSRASRDEGGLPLTFAQQRLWFIDQLEPGATTYNIPSVICLKGPLDLRALEETLSEIVRRHEILRTTFRAEGGQPSQFITPARPSALDLQDLSDSLEPEALAERLALEEAQRPFDLTRGPLLRPSLLRLEEETHLLLLTMHHIVSDGWSSGVLMREVSALYTAFRAGQQSPLPELEIQYGDYAVWQRTWLDGAALEDSLAYWKGQLSGAPSSLELPSDRPRPAVRSHRGAAVNFALPETLGERLRELARREGVTLYMLLLAAWQTLLMRYTGQEDIVVGSPVAGRTRAETEALIGFFVNTLVLRTDLSGDPTFKELLGRVREVCLGAYAHQEVPFEKVVEELAPERSLSHTPLFQVALTLHNEPVETRQLDGLTAEPFLVEPGTSKFDLSLALVERGAALTGTLRYSTDLFDAGTAERMLQHLRRLLEGAADDAGKRLSRLPLLTDDEEREVIVEWNDTKVERTWPERLHQLFEAQAAETPDARAVVCEDAELTYAELNSRANRLARHLRRMRGVGLESRVGVLMRPCAEMFVSLLAVLKAGGAYVPFSTETPVKRLSFMLEDARVSLLLTNSESADAARDCAQPTLLLDAERERIDAESDEDLRVEVCAENLAYIIYTSGSTGLPKGVGVSHRAICNRIAWGQHAYPLLSTDRVLQGAAFVFDFSVWEIFAPLAAGACVVVPAPGGMQDCAYLVGLIARRRVSVAHFVPTLFQMFLDEKGVEECESLRLVFCGGEALSASLQERFFARFEAELYNQYGPTEAAVDATFWRCTPDSARAAVPIGRPIFNTQIYLLDRCMQPVPPGALGELHIGGVGLARGYFGRAALTAERFIPDPFSTEAGARLYRTGDLARHLEGGAVEFAGRIDQQVKVRGQRIELSEVEHALSLHPSVRESAVVVREDERAEKRLVGYVVPREGQTPNASELRSFLRERLLEYMVPSAFVVLDRLPLTVNGKLDAGALPAPDQTRPELDGGFVAPRTETEEVLAAAWAKVLRLERVGVRDNFFDLGGHSLLATQLISAVRDLFRVELPLRSLFESPTVEGMAEALVRHEPAQGHVAARARLRRKLERMSPEEVRAALEGKRKAKGEVNS